MAIGTLEERVEKLEHTIQAVQEQLGRRAAQSKRGWRWFVGIDADNPEFDEAVRLGQDWRNSDRPNQGETR